MGRVFLAFRGKVKPIVYSRVSYAPAEKWRFNASGYVKCGPSRAPYRDLPENWKRQAELHGKGWAELAKKYSKSGAG